MIAKAGIKKLLSLSVDKFSIVDVGCHAGHFLEYLKPLLDRPSYWIGIDPIPCGTENQYDVVIEKAIYDVQDNLYRTFHKFNEAGCNSLLEMNNEVIERIHIGDVVVPTTSLEIVLNDLGFHDEIHLLKIDTQGSDIHVIRSLGKYSTKVHLVQMESISSHDKKKTLYMGQTIMEDDISEMEGLGFRLIYVTDHSVGSYPEADLIFENVYLSS